jgi:hypothetical protein
MGALLRTDLKWPSGTRPVNEAIDALLGETLYKAATCSGAICKAKALMAIRRLWLRLEGAA